MAIFMATCMLIIAAGFNHPNTKAVVKTIKTEHSVKNVYVKPVSKPIKVPNK